MVRRVAEERPPWSVILYFLVIFFSKYSLKRCSLFSGDQHPCSWGWHSPADPGVGRWASFSAGVNLDTDSPPLNGPGAHIQVKSAIFPRAMIYSPLKLAGPVSFLFLLSHTILK